MMISKRYHRLSHGAIGFLVLSVIYCCSEAFTFPQRIKVTKKSYVSSHDTSCTRISWRRKDSPLYLASKDFNHDHGKDSNLRKGGHQIHIEEVEEVEEERKTTTLLDVTTSLHTRTQKRRTILQSLVMSSQILLQNAQPSYAAKGAAEYDFDFYVRDLFLGNKKEGNILPSQPPPTPKPRHMSTLIRSIVNESCNGDCITVNELSKLLLLQKDASSSSSSVPASAEEIPSKIISFREKVSKTFQSKEPWDEESILDEYYFDMTCYALYRTASEYIPTNYVLRDTWVRNVGKEIYNLFLFEKEGMVQKEKVVPFNNDEMKKSLLTDTIPTLIQILDTFQSTNFIEGYRLGEKNDEVRTGKNIFDEYDNDDIATGLSVNLLVSVFRPATLGSSLQITGEGSRFSPDFISPTIAAMFEEELGLRVEYEGYFVDEEYRPNPKDFFPDEQLLQFTLKRSKK